MGGKLSWCGENMTQYWRVGNCHRVVRTWCSTQTLPKLMGGKLSWWLAVQHKPCQNWWVGNCHGDWQYNTNPANTEGGGTVKATTALQHKPCQHWWAGNCHGDYGITTQTLPTLRGEEQSWWLWHYNTNPTNLDGWGTGSAVVVDSHLNWHWTFSQDHTLKTKTIKKLICPLSLPPTCTRTHTHTHIHTHTHTHTHLMHASTHTPHACKHTHTHTHTQCTDWSKQSGG